MRIHDWKVLPLVLALAGCGSSMTSGPGARLEGMMDPASLSAARGSPVQVSIAGMPQSTTTDASGRFSFIGLAPGDATLRFAGSAFDVSVRIPGLVDKQTLQITVRITDRGVEVRRVKGDGITVVGAITAVGTSSITISGLAVDTDANTRIEDRGATLALSDLHVGDVVRVEGTLQAAGKVLASEIELLVPAGSAEALLRGVVDTVDAQGGSFTVSGLKVTTNASTKLVNVAAVGDLKVGDRVLVQGGLQTDGSVLARLVVKQQVEQEDENEDEIEGKITAITPPDRFVVAGKTVVVNATTEFEDDHEGKGGVDEHTLTFADLKVGDFVEVEGAFQADGTFLARKVERKNEEEDKDDDH